jgi:ribosome-binding protein aMBF1 (putative translation factor)
VDRRSNRADGHQASGLGELLRADQLRTSFHPEAAASGVEGAVNTKLKLALLEHGESQYAVARRLGVSETRLSRIVQGRLAPTPEERARLAEMLELDQDEVFQTAAGRGVERG